MLFSHDPEFHELTPGKWVQYKRKNDPTWYKLFPGYEAIVDPPGKSKKDNAVRGRRCRVLWIGEFSHPGKAVIQYLDSGKRGERWIHDLIPIPPDPVELMKYKAQKQA